MKEDIPFMCPPGTISKGNTKEEALENIKETKGLYLEQREHLLQKTCVEIVEVAV